jgi:hypothetical protein
MKPKTVAVPNRATELAMCVNAHAVGTYAIARRNMGKTQRLANGVSISSLMLMASRGARSVA